MKTRGQSRRKIAATSAVVLAAASVTWAQDAPPPGPEITVDVGIGAEIDDNAGLDDPSEGTTSELFTSIGVSLRNETAVDSLRLGVSTILQFSDSPSEGSEFEVLPPVATLSYSRLNRNSRFDVSGSYSRLSLEDTVLTFLDADLNPIDFTIDAGELVRTRARLGYELGIDSPLTVSFGLSYDDRDYVDTIDPDLYDRTTVRANAGASLAFSEVMTGRISASQTMFEADDAVNTERTTTDLGVGLGLAVSPVLDLDFGITYTDIEEIESGLTENRDGFGWSIRATRTFQDGTLTAGIERELSTSSDRTLVSFRRTMELATGDLSYGLGYSFADEGDDVLLANFGISRELADGRIGVSLSQTARGNDEDEDVRFTRLAVNFDKSINAVSSYSVDFGLARSDEIGTGAGDSSTRADLTISYSRALNEEWDWSLGYRGRYLNDEDDDARSNMLFTRIDRSFSIRP